MIHPKRTALAAVLVALFLQACAPSPTRTSLGEFVDDSTITTRVKAALIDDPAVRAAQVNVETYRGVVQLSGFVDSESAARQASNVARKIPGVQSVKNDLRVKPAR